MPCIWQVENPNSVKELQAALAKKQEAFAKILAALAKKQESLAKNEEALSKYVSSHVDTRTNMCRACIRYTHMHADMSVSEVYRNVHVQSSRKNCRA